MGTAEPALWVLDFLLGFALLPAQFLSFSLQLTTSSCSKVLCFLLLLVWHMVQEKRAHTPRKWMDPNVPVTAAPSSEKLLEARKTPASPSH